MGGWKLEVGRMALYMTFPVALFYYFNQPQYFEKWVTNFKREMYPPEDPAIREAFVQAMRDANRKYDEQQMKAQENI